MSTKAEIHTKYNSANRKLAIVGAGGFGRETLCCFMDAYDISAADIPENAVFLESDAVFVEREVNGVKVIPVSQLDTDKYEVVIAVGDPEMRNKIASQLPRNTRYATIIHPSVVLSEWVTIGEGSIITAGTILTCNISLGKHAHLNLHTTIGHDCSIGDYFTTAPGANVSGNCAMGSKVYVGTNAAIKQGVQICDEVVIGMGATVVKNITEPGTYIGSPAKRLIR